MEKIHRIHGIPGQKKKIIKKYLNYLLNNGVSVCVGVGVGVGLNLVHNFFHFI